MDISVVVCTKDRAKYLPKMLTALRQVRSMGIRWEVVFVDNGSSDETNSILEEFCNSFSVPTQVIHEPKKGLSTARNTGWKASSGTIVSFTDDDCYPHQDWLVTIVKAFQYSDADYIGGRVLLFDNEDAPITIQTSQSVIFFPKNSHVESGQIIGANFSCRRKILEAAGGFDSRLGAGTRFHSGEDTDLLIRASLLGFEGRYDPSIIVYHHHRRRLATEIRKLYLGYAYGRGAVSMKTILESNAKRLYSKNWYWRVRSLLRKRQFTYVLNELRGALRFIGVSKLQQPWSASRTSAEASPSRLVTKNFDIETLDIPPTFQPRFDTPLSFRLPSQEKEKSENE